MNYKNLYYDIDTDDTLKIVTFIGKSNAEVVTGDFLENLNDGVFKEADRKEEKKRYACLPETLIFLSPWWEPFIRPDGSRFFRVRLKFAWNRERGPCEDGTIRAVTWNRVQSSDGIWRPLIDVKGQKLYPPADFKEILK